MTDMNLNEYQSRTELAASLTAAGYPISPLTLASLGTRGGGPPYDIFSGRARYQIGSALEWAKLRVTTPRRRTDNASQPARAA